MNHGCLTIHDTGKKEGTRYKVRILFRRNKLPIIPMPNVVIDALEVRIHHLRMEKTRNLWAMKPRRMAILHWKGTMIICHGQQADLLLECMRKRLFHHSPLTTRVVNFTNITTLHFWMSSGKFTHHSQEEDALGAVKKTHHSSKIYHSEWWVVKKMSFFVFAHTLYCEAIWWVVWSC